jgi:hypothetical protein
MGLRGHDSNDPHSAVGDGDLVAQAGAALGDHELIHAVYFVEVGGFHVTVAGSFPCLCDGCEQSARLYLYLALLIAVCRETDLAIVIGRAVLWPTSRKNCWTDYGSCLPPAAR